MMCDNDAKVKRRLKKHVHRMDENLLQIGLNFDIICPSTPDKRLHKLCSVTV